MEILSGMTELEQYITSYFGVSAEDLKRISALFKPVLLKKGAFFLKTGEKCEELSFVRSGILRVYVATEKEEITQWIGTKGYFIADLGSLIFETPARWTIQALTDMELYSISKVDYNAIGNYLPQWHYMEKLFIARCFTIMEDRIFNHLSMSAEERYVAFFESNRELFNQVPLHYIASMLGMTPETFSRIRKKQLS